MRNLCQVLGIKQNMLSAYHLQTDGQSEWSNQWVEQFLQHWSNTQQDNWADLLPIAQFAHNSWINATTKSSPFKLLMGSEPRTTWEERRTKVQTVDEHLQEITEACSKCNATTGVIVRRAFWGSGSRAKPYQGLSLGMHKYQVELCSRLV